MKLLATFLSLNLVFCGWAVAIEDPSVEEAALSFNQLLIEDLAAEETSLSLRNVCNETLTTTSGMITSPDFPQNYENNLSCYWLIVSSTGTIISLSFESFFVETNLDYLRVRLILCSINLLI